MPRYIEIIYKCRCMDAEATLQMRERRIHEDLADYMQDIQKTLGKDHSQRSPVCVAGYVEYVKIPADDPEAPIGTAKGGTA